MVKHLIVKPKSTFERFKPRPLRAKGVKVFASHKVHMCDGTKRGPKYKHVPTAMRRSGYAQSGHALIQRWECGLCGLKTTAGRTG